MQKIGSKIGFPDLSMGSWGRRPSFLALLCTNRGRGIVWRRFYSNRSRSWKVDFLTSPPPSSKGVVFQKFFFAILSSGTYILSILFHAEKFCDMWCQCLLTNRLFLQRPCLKIGNFGPKNPPKKFDPKFFLLVWVITHQDKSIRVGFGKIPNITVFCTLPQTTFVSASAV